MVIRKQRRGVAGLLPIALLGLAGAAPADAVTNDAGLRGFPISPTAST